MSTELIRLFPLSLVLVPAMPLPLHIFEERYKEMMGEIVPSGAEFGVVLAKGGGIVNIGCSARVEQVLRRYPDGRLDVIAIGSRRFRIESLDEEKSYLRAEVEFFNDEDVTQVPQDLRDKAIAGYRKLAETEDADDKQEPDFDAVRISFQIARLISDLDKRQTVLALRSEVERLEYLIRVLPEYLNQQERIALAKRVAPLNGHPRPA
jgi:Lon protease-like protein